MAVELSAREARLLALASQGFAGRRSVDSSLNGPLDVLDRLSLLQIDSVNVFERAHYLPSFSRLGNYAKASLDELSGGSSPTLIEYWAHEASLIRTEDLPLYRWRMDAYRAKQATEDGGWALKNRPLLDWLLNEVREKGPLTASAIEHDANRRRGSWWGWSDVKLGLEWLFLMGDLVSGGRSKFSRLYDVPERVLPKAVLEGPQPSHAEARATLLERAARAHGVATARDLADYHRMKPRDASPILTELVEAGRLIPASVEGWQETAYLHPGAPALLESVAGGGDSEDIGGSERATLISPFDPLLWYRPRAERLFDFHYRIEIYTPAPKRVFGYYCLPILFGDRIVGRIDLKSERKQGELQVLAAWHEPWLGRREQRSLLSALERELKLAARWQGLERVTWNDRGNLAELRRG